MFMLSAKGSTVTAKRLSLYPFGITVSERVNCSHGYNFFVPLCLNAECFSFHNDYVKICKKLFAAPQAVLV